MQVGSIPVVKYHKTFDYLEDLPVLFINEYKDIDEKLLKNCQNTLEKTTSENKKINETYWFDFIFFESKKDDFLIVDVNVKLIKYKKQIYFSTIKFLKYPIKLKGNLIVGLKNTWVGNMISVIMSVFNNEDEVKHAIESILKNQDYKNFEFLIIDDASTDNTLDILLDLENKFNNIRILKNSENIGLTKSLNKLIESSNGEFIARQDADDFSLPFRFSKQLSFFKKYNIFRMHNKDNYKKLV